MGFRININCERCGEEISYVNPKFELKRDGYNHNLCENCVKERRKKLFDDKITTE